VTHDYTVFVFVDYGKSPCGYLLQHPPAHEPLKRDDQLVHFAQEYDSDIGGACTDRVACCYAYVYRFTVHLVRNCVTASRKSGK
jgi:hypothetical protein